jgi:hypothetical protein
VKSKTSDKFWKCYENLPIEIKKKSKESYQLFQKDPYHPSLHFKKIHSNRPIFSVRVSKNYRAVGVVEKDEIIWFWIGSHSEYNKLIKKK